jgi:uroporphyrinogen-III decarboxylase
VRGPPLPYAARIPLRLEKADLACRLGIPNAETWHFAGPFAPRNQAHIDAVRYIACETDLVPVGMAIGPFSLMTKLLEDPITPVAMAGMGMTDEDDPGVLAVVRCLEIAEAAVTRSVAAQVTAGAQAVLICEPAANVVYLSPRQIEAGSDIFERFVIAPNLRLRERMAAAGVDLIFHNCGQLTSRMVEQFAHRLHPAVLSLGSSRVLWEDAALVPADVVLYGNLPTKSFYSDAAMPADKVRALAAGLTARMRACGHPHILGSECDVLHVPEAAATIRRKVDAMLAPLT